jgi:hypothetical protein
MKLLPEEIKLIKLSPRCEVCDHLDILHQLHSCGECLVMDCDCAYEPEEEGAEMPDLSDLIPLMILGGKVEFVEMNPKKVTDDGKTCPRCKCLYDDMQKGLQGRNGACECDCGHKSPTYLRTNN